MGPHFDLDLYYVRLERLVTDAMREWVWDSFD